MIGIGKWEDATAVALDLVARALGIARTAIAQQARTTGVAAGTTIVGVDAGVGADRAALGRAGVAGATAAEAIGTGRASLVAGAAVTFIARDVDAGATAVA